MEDLEAWAEPNSVEDVVAWAEAEQVALVVVAVPSTVVAYLHPHSQ